jgi:hypothetical protein
MFPIPSSEKLVETKVCRHCSEKFPITDKDVEFYEKVSPTFGGKNYQIPTPTLCPDCRQQRRLSFRNERKLYKRTCDATGKEIISIYSPDKPFKVYHQDMWWSDKWDPMKYGKIYDPERSFFEQFRELIRTVPVPCLQSVNGDNSAYCNFTKSMKDSYLAIGSSESENTYYAYRAIRSQDIVDASFILDSSVVFDSINLVRCHNVAKSQNCQDCHDCTFCFQCENCNHCFGCSNLRNASYSIFQKAYTPDAYEIELKKVQTMDANALRQYMQPFMISKNIQIIGSEGCIGDEIKNSKNCKGSFGIQDGENLRYSYDLYNHSKDTIDCFSGYGPLENCYESSSFGMNSSHLYCCENTFDTTNGAYLHFCYNSHDLFGCIGLRNKQYCILNKQYTKDEYESLVSKIIEEMQRV